ncbi:MAG: CoA pyrophosphatase [Lachnospiraceae bacterium]|jgi:8-oxo-dGTP pyrophosphatase MutT (NUDIX family)|nr:CoA pyrophosphatase [Lachnospiraceae bacterium]
MSGNQKQHCAETLFADHLEKMFAGRGMETIRPDTDRCAAVLIPVVIRGGEPNLLFEVRADGLPQGGEICFPGGTLERGESSREAAVRETAEELLIGRNRIRVVAPMFQMPGPGGTWIRSYLGVLNDYRDTWSRDEVDHVFFLPFSWLKKKEPVVSHVLLKVDDDRDFPYDLIPGGRDYPLRKLPRAYYFYETDHGVIWGMTAELLYHFSVSLKELPSASL